MIALGAHNKFLPDEPLKYCGMLHQLMLEDLSESFHASVKADNDMASLTCGRRRALVNHLYADPDYLPCISGIPDIHHRLLHISQANEISRLHHAHVIPVPSHVHLVFFSLQFSHAPGRLLYVTSVVCIRPGSA